MSQINELLAQAVGRIGGLPKNEKNKEQNFMFRSIDAITVAAKPVFAELGISVTPRLLEKDYEEVTAKSGARGWRCTVTMEYTFGAPDGSERISSMGGEAIDYGDKSTTKAEQMAYKYALTQVLLIGSGDADPDAESHDLAEESEAIAAWRRLWEDAKVLKSWSDEERMAAIKAAMKLLKIEEVTDQDKAEAILAHVTAEYAKRPMETQEALPVE